MLKKVRLYGDLADFVGHKELDAVINTSADAVRFFILSDSTPEKDVQWSEDGMLSSYKFVQKFWILNEQINFLIKEKECETDENLENFTNRVIYEITQFLEHFKYNLLFSAYHKIYSYFKKVA